MSESSWNCDAVRVAPSRRPYRCCSERWDSRVACRCSGSDSQKSSQIMHHMYTWCMICEDFRPAAPQHGWWSVLHENDVALLYLRNPRDKSLQIIFKREHRRCELQAPNSYGEQLAEKFRLTTIATTRRDTTPASPLVAQQHYMVPRTHMVPVVL